MRATSPRAATAALGTLFIFLLFSPAAEAQVPESMKLALITFMDKLSPPGGAQSFGWTNTSDPCTGSWTGAGCDTKHTYVKNITLDHMNLTGILDIDLLCRATPLLLSLSLNGNNISGSLSEGISSCKQLNHLYLLGNRLSGNIPGTFRELINLKRINISGNAISGDLPDMSGISGLLSFYAHDNLLSGKIPNFNFSGLRDFNISNNDFTGPIPDGLVRFGPSSFSGNPGLCGNPSQNACPPAPPPPVSSPPTDEKKPKSRSKLNSFLIYSGYVILGLIVAVLIAMLVLRKKAAQSGEKTDKSPSKELKSDIDINSQSSEYKNGGRSEFSITSAESGAVSSSLVVLSSPVVNGLKFEDLLRAPAELIGRGKHGSLYKVLPVGSVALVVKRIKDWQIPREEFKKKMQRIDQVKHPKVVPIVAYYFSKQEKLLVYEYYQNGSLHALLHGTEKKMFDWGSRLSVASGVAEGLAYMHEQLGDDGIAHGNIKSSNILLNKDMDPVISEYGLMVVTDLDESSPHGSKNSSVAPAYSTFKLDVYAFGVILLELLTGRPVRSDGFDLAKWVNSVVKEEWTGEVFDKGLISAGANEERMVNLLQVALKCINPSPEGRPSMSQVATMINSIKENEERSMSCSSDP